MKILGIVAEYNPFHKGHLYHLEQAKSIVQPDLTIVVMSGAFVQRGEPAIINKTIRSQIAVEQGVDIVIELPFVYTVQSADYFAYAALYLLNELGVTDLVFGSEDGQVSELITIAKAISDNQVDYDRLVKEAMDQGLRYPDACNQALKIITHKEVRTPNDILGLCYVKEIVSHGYNIIPHAIKRIGDYHDNTITTLASASALRQALYEHQDVSDQLPGYHHYNDQPLYRLDDFYELLRYNILFNDHLEDIHLVDEGLDDLLRKVVIHTASMEELINALTSRRYTRSRIQRMFIHILMNNTKTAIKQAMTLDYIRLLGLSIKGQAAIKTLKKQTSLPIITKISDYSSNTLNYEIKAAQLLSLVNRDALEQEIRCIPYRQIKK